MAFEYDPNKSALNRDRHGIDFEQAQAIWADDAHIEVEVLFVSEARFLAIGLIDNKLWTAVWTWRGPNRRLISVRRSRDDESKSYHGR